MVKRRANHGVWLSKWDAEAGKELHTNVPTKPRSIAPNLLGQILSQKQTGLGSAGLRRLIDQQRRGRRREDDEDDEDDEDHTGANPARRQPRPPQ